MIKRGVTFSETFVDYDDDAGWIKTNRSPFDKIRLLLVSFFSSRDHNRVEGLAQ